VLPILKSTDRPTVSDDDRNGSLLSLVMVPLAFASAGSSGTIRTFIFCENKAEPKAVDSLFLPYYYFP